MTDILLTRLKPDPLPAIRPLPEHLAEGALKAAYEATKQGLQVPWMGVVAMAFARYPTFYAALWSGLEPVAGHARFAAACAELRAAAESAAARLPSTALVPRLRAAGYAPAELDEIRACAEVFAAGNMPYVLMATLARLLLEGHAWSGAGEAGPYRARPAVAAKPPLMERHHADPATRALYDELMRTLGLPFVNTDYRALARWPSYFAIAWADLKQVVEGPGYAAAVQAAHEAAVHQALALPNLAGLTPAGLVEAARQDAPLGEVLDVVRLFQWLLPGLIVNVACLQVQLDPAPGGTAAS